MAMSDYTTVMDVQVRDRGLYGLGDLMLRATVRHDARGELNELVAPFMKDYLAGDLDIRIGSVMVEATPWNK